MMTLVLTGTSPTVVAAIITASASLVVALVTGLSTRRNSARVQKLEEERAESDAQRAYRYEASKRLYTVCEPVLFQAVEQAEYASSRIYSLARTARDGHLLPDGNGWLSAPQRYYFRSIVYGLLAPLTAFTMLQRQLTSIDLQLDDKVRQRYELLKLIFLSPSQDWELAKYDASPLLYDRDRTDPGEPERERLLLEAPEYYAPQGLYRATIYVIAEAFTTVLSGAAPEAAVVPARCISFGEFAREWESEVSDSAADECERPSTEEPRSRSTMAPIYHDVVELFTGFHPARKPVLWRVLIYQHLLYRMLASGRLELLPLTPEDRGALEWQSEGDGSSADTLRVVEGFAGEQLAELHNRLAT